MEPNYDYSSDEDDGACKMCGTKFVSMTRIPWADIDAHFGYEPHIGQVGVCGECYATIYPSNSCGESHA